MSESIDLTNLPKRKQRVAIPDRQLREAKMESRIAELEQQLAEAQAKAELWNKVRPYFRYVSTWRDWFEFNGVIPRKDGDTIEDAVRRLP